MNKKTLITGSNGFFGRIISSEFNKENILTIDLKGADINCDISTTISQITDKSISKIIHCAGKAHSIPKTEKEKQLFFDINSKGTANLLNALEPIQSHLNQFIFISTVAVYGIYEGVNIHENHPLKACTPYGKSKLEAERLVETWCKKNQINYLILRLPLLAGKNAPGNLGAMKKAISKNRYPKIIGNDSKKSMVLAKDVAKLMARWVSPSGIYHITDGYHPSFSEIEKAIEKRIGGTIKIKIPLPLIKILAQIGDLGEKLTGRNLPISKLKLKKLTSTLTFDDSKARKQLNWISNPVLPFIEKEL